MIRRLKDHINKECNRRATSSHQPQRSPTGEDQQEATEAVVSIEVEVITMVSSEDVASIEAEELQEANSEEDPTELGEEVHHTVEQEEDTAITGKSKLNTNLMTKRSVMDQSHLPKMKLHS